MQCHAIIPSKLPDEECVRRKSIMNAKTCWVCLTERWVKTLLQPLTLWKQWKIPLFTKMCSRMFPFSFSIPFLNISGGIEKLFPLTSLDMSHSWYSVEWFQMCLTWCLGGTGVGRPGTITWIPQHLAWIVLGQVQLVSDLEWCYALLGQWLSGFARKKKEILNK